MRFKYVSPDWQGVLLALVLCIVSLWLAATGKLVLYIHPRYIWFTALLCGIATVWITIGIALRYMPSKVWRPISWFGLLTAGICLVLVVSAVVLRPKSLTSSTASGRGVNTTAISGLDQETIATTSAAAFEGFSLREWVSVLSMSQDAAFYQDKKAHVSGFIVPTEDNNPNVFYLSRFIITCCAVDAQPIGMAVYAPDWRQTYKADQWVEVRGGFRQITTTKPIIAVLPDTIRQIDQPEDPYAR